jgi:hypothetical protein
MWCGTRLYFLSLTPEYSRAGVEWLSDEDEEPDGQLYDLAVDPSEKNNLWDVKPGMVKKIAFDARSGKGQCEIAKRGWEHPESICLMRTNALNRKTS